MAALTGCATINFAPGIGKKEIVITTPAATTDDTIDVSSRTATGGDTLRSIDHIIAWNKEDGEAVSVTSSGTTITVGAAVTAKVLNLRVLGE